jgi:acetyl-CoA C-acetyltransferase
VIETAIVGAGLHKFGRFPNKTIEEIGQEAVTNALKDAGNMDWRKVQAVFCGTMHGGTATGQRVLANIGLTGIPVTNVETACASGGSALKLAIQSVASGEYDIAMALGIEKAGSGFLALSSYPKWQNLSGLGVPPIQLGLTAMRYMYDYDISARHLAMVAVKNRKNASLNPNAIHQRPTTLERVLDAKMIAYPFTLLMLASPCEGAAAVVITSKSKAAAYTSAPITVAAAFTGVAQYGTDFCGMSSGFETDSARIRNPEVTTVLSRKAYEFSGIAPEDIDMLELNDATAASELILMEEIGICKRGEAPKMLAEGRTEINGDIAVSTSGGLLGMGEPVGAVGIGQAIEIVTQLRGNAGPRQVPGAKTGMCQSAGAGGNCTVTILKK